MQSIEELRQTLLSMDGRGYKGYKQVRGVYEAGDLILAIDHVQGDPFAAPSRIRVIGPVGKTDWPELSNRIRRVALQDFIARCASASIQARRDGRRDGSGKSGQIQVDAGGQQVIERTSCLIRDDGQVELRLSVGLPAAGRRILGRSAAELLSIDVLSVAKEAFSLGGKEHVAGEFVDIVEDSVALRHQLEERGLVAFVPNGAILPRASGISQRALRGSVIPFQSPDDLRMSLERPNGGTITGMGIPEGITVIVGGGFHGKSTLLEAVSRGIYNHIPEDGREHVVTRDDGVKIRAEDGRRIEMLNLQPFISELPLGRTTHDFSTENASGSTSQAANILEAVEVGSRLLIMDEDTCATNFMMRDEIMRELVPASAEPITPFIDRVREMYEVHGISSILVMGGSSDYFRVADTVIWMNEYRPSVVTRQAHLLAGEKRGSETETSFPPLSSRAPKSGSIDPQRRNRTRVRAHGVEEIRFGDESIDLRQVEQIADPSQTRAVGDSLALLVRENMIDGNRSIHELVEWIDAEIERNGIDSVSAFEGHPGDLARPRKFEIAAAINRLRSLRMTPV